MKAFVRAQHHKWLNQVSQWSNVVGLSGLRGCGKSTLVRHWCFLSDKKIKIISFARFGDFSEILGQAGESHEIALESFIKTLTKVDVVIWEDLHHLAPKVLSSLIPFLKSQFSSSLHILISDESLEDFKMEIPISQVSPLLKEELKSYLSDFLQIDSKLDLDSLLAKTGGFPVYLNMWAQSANREIGTSSSMLSSLTESEVKSLQCISIFPQGYPQEDSSLVEKAQIQNLEKKLFVILQNQKCFIQAGLFEMVRSSITDADFQTFSKAAFLELLRIKSTDALPMLTLALQAKSIDLVKKVAASVEPKSFEGLPTQDLNFFESLMLGLNISQDQKSFDHSEARLFRILLHIQILSGNRNSALELSQSIQKILPPTTHWDNEIFLLIYDIIHWNHRSGKFKEVEEILGVGSNLAKSEMKSLFRLEQAFCYVEKNPERALETLNQLIQTVEADPKVGSQVWFQKGRAHYFLAQYQESAFAYGRAANLYKAMGQTYFYLITQMNLLWTYLELKNFEAYQTISKDILELSQRYGYKYIKAGCLLAAAQMDRSEMQHGKALERVLEAEKLLPLNAPPKARVDLIFEKVLIFGHLGLLEEAEKCVLQLESKDLQLKARLFAGLLESSSEDMLDIWKFEKNDHYRMLALHVGTEISSADEQALSLSKLGKWSVLESSLTKSLKLKDSDHAWVVIGQLESLIQNIGEMSCERIALSLLQAQLSSEAERVKWLSRVEIELKRWGCDERFKNPFRAWYIAISTGTRLSEVPEWKQSRLNDQERWSRWAQGLTQKSSSSHILVTSDKTTEVQQLEEMEMTSLKKRYKVFLVEDLGQVFVKSKEIKEFHRKSVLRQILALILDSYPATISKTQLSLTVWGESYSSEVYDSRIYTSIQRLRDLIGDSSIIAWDGGYKWNATFAFAFLKSRGLGVSTQHKVQTLIVQALQNFKKSGKQWASRSELLDVTGSSESTLKRELSKLMLQEMILRKGSGPSTVYSIR